MALYAELGVGPAPERAAFEGTLVAHALVFEDAAGGVGGYVLAEAAPPEAYVRQLVVRPSLRGGGLGERLMRAAAARLRGQGCTRWSLNVKPDNAAALALYRRLGLEPGTRTRVWVVDPAALHGAHDVAERGTHADRPAADRDAEAASALGVALETLTRARGSALGGVFRRASAEGATVAWAAVDPRGPFVRAVFAADVAAFVAVLADAAQATGPAGHAGVSAEGRSGARLPQTLKVAVASPEHEAALTRLGARPFLESLELFGALPP